MYHFQPFSGIMHLSGQLSYKKPVSLLNWKFREGKNLGFASADFFAK